MRKPKALVELRVCGASDAYAVPPAAYVSIRQYTSEYVSIRQHTSAYDAYAVLMTRNAVVPRIPLCMQVRSLTARGKAL